MNVRVSTGSPVDTADAEQARAAITEVLESHGLREARIRLAAPTSLDGSAVIQVNLRINGAAARVQVAAPTTGQAISIGASRLSRQVERLLRAWEPWPWPDPERPVLSCAVAGHIARMKTPPLHNITPCQATATLNAMDYDVFLFTDIDTDEDAVIFRAGATGHQLARQRALRPPALAVTLPLTVQNHRAPRLTPADAAHQLATAQQPFVFFTDLHSRRGNLLYRRYDGNLGLISPGFAIPLADSR